MAFYGDYQESEENINSLIRQETRKGRKKKDGKDAANNAARKAEKKKRGKTEGTRQAVAVANHDLVERLLPNEFCFSGKRPWVTQDLSKVVLIHNWRDKRLAPVSTQFALLQRPGNLLTSCFFKGQYRRFLRLDRAGYDEVYRKDVNPNLPIERAKQLIRDILGVEPLAKPRPRKKLSPKKRKRIQKRKRKEGESEYVPTTAQLVRQSIGETAEAPENPEPRQILSHPEMARTSSASASPAPAEKPNSERITAEFLANFRMQTALFRTTFDRSASGLPDNVCESLFYEAGLDLKLRDEMAMQELLQIADTDENGQPVWKVGTEGIWLTRKHSVHGMINRPDTVQFIESCGFAQIGDQPQAAAKVPPVPIAAPEPPAPEPPAAQPPAAQAGPPVLSEAMDGGEPEPEPVTFYPVPTLSLAELVIQRRVEEMAKQLVPVPDTVYVPILKPERWHQVPSYANQLPGVHTRQVASKTWVGTFVYVAPGNEWLLNPVMVPLPETRPRHIAKEPVFPSAELFYDPLLPEQEPEPEAEPEPEPEPKVDTRKRPSPTEARLLSLIWHADRVVKKHGFKSGVDSRPLNQLGKAMGIKNPQVPYSLLKKKGYCDYRFDYTAGNRNNTFWYTKKVTEDMLVPCPLTDRQITTILRENRLYQDILPDPRPDPATKPKKKPRRPPGPAEAKMLSLIWHANRILRQHGFRRGVHSLSRNELGRAVGITNPQIPSSTLRKKGYYRFNWSGNHTFSRTTGVTEEMLLLCPLTDRQITVILRKNPLYKGVLPDPGPEPELAPPEPAPEPVPEPEVVEEPEPEPRPEFPEELLRQARTLTLSDSTLNVIADHQLISTHFGGSIPGRMSNWLISNTYPNNSNPAVVRTPLRKKGRKIFSKSPADKKPNGDKERGNRWGLEPLGHAVIFVNEVTPTMTDEDARKFIERFGYTPVELTAA